MIEVEYHLPTHPAQVDLYELLEQADRVMIRLIRSENATALLEEAIQKKPEILTIEKLLRVIITTDVDSAIAELAVLKEKYLANSAQIEAHFATLEKMALEFKKGS